MIVHVYSDIDALPERHYEFLQKHTKDKFFFSALWFKNLIKTTVDDNINLKFYVVEDDNSGNTPHCFFPARSPANHRGSILRFHGTGLNSLSGITSNKTILFSPIFLEGESNLSNVFYTFAKYLYLEDPRWELIDFSSLDMEPNVLYTFKKMLNNAGYFAVEYRAYSNWFEPVNGTFQNYVALLPKSNRKAIKNYIRKYKNLNKSNQISIVLYENPEDIEKGINDYEIVFRDSWKDEDTNSSFIPELIRSGFSSQKIRLMVLYFDQRPAAVELAILHGGKGVLLRTAYCPEYAKYSVGSIILLKMMEHLINKDHVSEIDFGRDDELYKKIWVTRQRYRKGLIAYNLKTVWGLYGYIRCCLSLFRDYSVSKLKPLIPVL